MGVKPLLSTVLVLERSIQGLRFMAPSMRQIQRLELLEWSFLEHLFPWRSVIMQTSCSGQFNRNCSMLEPNVPVLPTAFLNRCRLLEQSRAND